MTHFVVTMPGCLLLFVFFDLAVDFIAEDVDGGVHVFIDRIGEDIAAGQVEGRLCFMAQFFHAEDDLRLRHLIAVTLDPFQPVVNIIT